MYTIVIYIDAIFVLLFMSNTMIVSEKEYLNYKENSIQGRYVVNEKIIDFFEGTDDFIQKEIIGHSVQKRPIMCLTLGTGKHKILMWSQMHGNESTTTKAVLDLINLLFSKTDSAISILNSCTIKIIPILNPDGAVAYTRVNANAIDLNRDAQDRSQPESNILRKVYENFQPDFCFNLHDQRTIFNVGETAKPATVSFLAPAQDAERSITPTRAIAMRLIVAMNLTLQNYIPSQIGRYDDGFNANCVGDTFQMLNTPTILFESGHAPEDYGREKTREYIFYAMLTAIDVISNNKIATYVQDDYFNIPENNKLFFDILVKNADSINKTFEGDVGILYVETLKEDTIVFVPKIEKTGNLDKYYGHKTYNCLDDIDLNIMKKESFWDLLKP